jgi:hypothetical protein
MHHLIGSPVEIRMLEVTVGVFHFVFIIVGDAVRFRRGRTLF